jgi:hypothetical protein
LFACTEGIRPSFHVLHSLTRFRRYRGRRFQFSYFALPDLFSALQRASSPVSMFCAPGPVFGIIEGVGSSFHILRSWTCFWRFEGVEFSFHVLRSRSRFRRYRGRRVQVSCFVLPNPFSAVPRVPGPVFMFCALGPIIGGTEGIRSSFHVLRFRTRFRRTDVAGSSFHVLSF